MATPPRRTTSDVKDERARVVVATQRFVPAVQGFLAELAACGVELDQVRLPEDLEAFVDYAVRGLLEEDVEQLAQAWQIVRSNTPVAAAAPHSWERVDESWRRWRGPLHAGAILDMADLAQPSDAGYLTQLQANADYFAEKERRQKEDRSTKCGRPTSTGSACSNQATYVPGGKGFQSGAACHRHHTEDEKQRIIELFRLSIATVDCPGCTAKAGAECRLGDDAAPDLILVNGEWPRVRHIGGVQAHDVRLDALHVEAAAD